MLRSVFCLPNRSKRYQINDFSLRSFNVVWTNRYQSFSEMKTLHKFFGPLKEIALVKLIDCVVWYSYSLWSASLMTLDSRASQCVIFASESHSSVKLRTNEIESVGVWKVVRCLAIGPFSVLTFRHSVNCYGINDTRLHLSHHLSSWTPISYFVMLFQLRFMFLTLRQSSFCPIFCPSIRFHCVLFFLLFYWTIKSAFHLSCAWFSFFVYFQDSSVHLETPFKLNSFCMVWYKRCNLLSHEYRQSMWCNNECLKWAQNEFGKINISSALKLCGFAAHSFGCVQRMNTPQPAQTVNMLSLWRWGLAA